MTFEEFYKRYLSHVKETPRKIPLKFDGYELRYANGDVYRYEETLKPGRTPSWWGNYAADDFTYHNTWNGEVITQP